MLSKISSVVKNHFLLGVKAGNKFPVDCVTIKHSSPHLAPPLQPTVAWELKQEDYVLIRCCVSLHRLSKVRQAAIVGTRTKI